jgi:hypothetical protein
VRVLIEHDFAPYAAANLFDVHGTASMIPLAAIFAACVLWTVFAGRSARERLAIAIAGALVCLVVSWPLQIDPRPGHTEIRAALGLITRIWDPAGYDTPARLEAELAQHADADGYLRLAELYDEEGRDREALIARRRAASLARQARRD